MNYVKSSMRKSTGLVMIVFITASCAKPLFVSHLSHQGIALTKKKGYGMPVHHWYSPVICFDKKCIEKAAWAKSQKKHRYNGFKNIEPALKNLVPHVSVDSTVLAKRQPANRLPTKQLQLDSVIVLSGEVFFDFNSAELKKELQSKLDSISSFLIRNSKFNAAISGHTDNSGNETYNLKLSERRAENVANYLIDNGIQPERMSFVGFGSFSPIANNSTEEGRRKNRRVEIRMRKK